MKLVELEGIEPSDSRLARTTRNPITSPVRYLYISSYNVPDYYLYHYS